ncbi:LysR family transcriptional regulator [Xylocopilactobacillus apicola]|uniref:LysR family transcriptional regulator n=1 Tax=Xylocopilactobacillus apicola TaxID=2932184 RepID=A0AAU9D5X6_9LACO|nr:LysR family transcriptional regulator [Xylocopilactobacillus apicola]BDR57680.1 LysR family transcriptional regulator [Xylocopilactobacillus apicola]
MNLRDLEYFNKLVELKNYSHTAHYFGVSQPTISYTIQRLEEQAGIDLLDRKSMTLTEAGQQFYNHSRKVVQEMSMLDKDMENAASPHIKIGLPPIITNYLLHQEKYLSVFQQNLEHLEVYSSESQKLFRSLVSGNLDASFIGSVEPISSPDLTSHIIARHHFKIICSQKSPLATKKTVSFNDLQSYPFLLLDRESTHQQIFAQLVRKNLFVPRIIFRTPAVQTILTLVENNSGISFLTEAALTAANQKVVAIDLNEASDLYFYLNLVTLKNGMPDHHLTEFINAMLN